MLSCYVGECLFDFWAKRVSRTMFTPVPQGEVAGVDLKRANFIFPARIEGAPENPLALGLLLDPEPLSARTAEGVDWVVLSDDESSGSSSNLIPRSRHSVGGTAKDSKGKEKGK